MDPVVASPIFGATTSHRSGGSAPLLSHSAGTRTCSMSRVAHWENEAVLDRVQARLDQRPDATNQASGMRLSAGGAANSIADIKKRPRSLMGNSRCSPCFPNVKSNAPSPLGETAPPEPGNYLHRQSVWPEN